MPTRTRAKRLGIVSHGLRSLPQQKRSRLTVDSIRQATLELSRRGGFANLTTNQIADRAGVSIGTLYQYFSTVEAIFISMFEEASVSFAEATKALMVSMLDAPIRVAVPAVIDRLLKMYDKVSDVLLRLPAEVPELNLVDRPMAFDNLVRGGIRTYLEWHFPSMGKRDVARKVFFLEQVELSCIRRFLLSRPPGLSRREFIHDLSGLIISYIEAA